MSEINSLEHHGIKGQRWGIRRTPEQLGRRKGMKKLAKELKKDYKQNYDRTNPFKTSVSYNKKLVDSISKAITDDDKKRIRNAYKEWFSKQEEADKAVETLDRIARKYGKKYYDDEIKRNPDAYNTPRSKQELREFADFDFGMSKAIEERPDLDRASYIADKAWISYMAECSIMSDMLLGRYGNTKLNQSRDYSLKIKDTVDSMVSLMDGYNWDLEKINKELR